MQSIIRALAACASIAIGYVACVALLAMTGGPGVPSVLVAFALLALGFAGLAILRTSATPGRPVRASLAVGGFVTAYLLRGLPFPPHGADIASALILCALLVNAVATAWLLDRRPTVARVLLALGAGCGVLLCARFAWILGSTPGSPQGPARVFAYTLAAMAGIAWISALWHARALWRRPMTSDVSAVAA